MGSSNKIDISRFDPTNASDDQIRLWLFAIIQAELEKDDAEIDAELIDECSDCEAFLSHNNPEITQEEYAIGLARIKERAQAMQAEGSNVTVQAKPKKRRFMRVAAYILAAALAIAILSVGVVAAFNGSAAWEFITTNIQQILGMEPGDSLEGDKVTLVKGDLVAEYDSVEEALKAGGFEGILYPTVLPEGYSIKQVVTSKIDDQKFEVTFVFNYNDLRCGVSNYPTDNVANWETYDKYQSNGITYYTVYIESNNTFQTVWSYNGYYYHINYTNFDSMLNILDNMKGVEE